MAHVMEMSADDHRGGPATFFLAFVSHLYWLLIIFTKLEVLLSKMLDWRIGVHCTVMHMSGGNVSVGAMSLVPAQGRSQVQLPFTLLCNRFSDD